MEIVLEASHTHLYPGHEGKVAGVGTVPAMPAGATCRIDFADGSVALGSLTHERGDDWTLEVSPYTTAAGTPMPAKRWRLGLRQEEDRVAFRIRRKLAG